VARNDDRRSDLADSGIRVLARQGARGLTHRAIDVEAGVPIGTASNYFRSRDAIVNALLQRIGERLQPDESVLRRLGRQQPSKKLFAAYIRYVVQRLMADRDVTLALFELRLEATRNDEVAARLRAWLQGNFVADVAFNRAAGLPGGPKEIALFHYAMDGLVFDRLTLPIDERTSTDAVVAALVEGLLPDST
jgi:DNA-binding transcriptional regulator YbjK